MQVKLSTMLGVFLLGTVFGTLGDYLHILSHTDGYTNPLLPLPSGQPFWVPFLFGSATWAISLTHPLTDWGAHRLFKIKTTLPRSFLSVLSACFASFLLYAISGFLPFSTGGLRDIVLGLGAFGIWFVYDRTPKGAFLAACTAFVGAAIEIYLTQSEAFYYFSPVANFFGIPSWIPWLYVGASVGIGNLGRWVYRT